MRNVAPAAPDARPARSQGQGAQLAPRIAGGVAVLVLLGIAGWALGGIASPDPAPPRAPIRAVDLGPLAVDVDSSWAASDKRRDLAGLDPATARAFAPSPGLSSRAIVALTPLGDPSLVPPALRSELGRPLPEPEATTVAGAKAWVYRTPGGRRRDTLAEVSVIPTTAGVLSVTCRGSRFTWNAAVGCAAGVQRIRLGDARALAPADDTVFRLRLPAALDRLNERRVAGRAALRRSRTPGRQARAAIALWRANRLAASDLAALAPRVGPAAGLVAALHATAQAYRSMAAAARNEWPGRFAQARRSVAAREAGVRRQLKRLDNGRVSS